MKSKDDSFTISVFWHKGEENLIYPLKSDDKYFLYQPLTVKINHVTVIYLLPK